LAIWQPIFGFAVFAPGSSCRWRERARNALTAQPAQLLAHLVEFEERMLHLELGFSSLFAYRVDSLGMSEGSAGRRVTAAPTISGGVRVPGSG